MKETENMNMCTFCIHLVLLYYFNSTVKIRWGEGGIWLLLKMKGFDSLFYRQPTCNWTFSFKDFFLLERLFYLLSIT